MKKQSIAIPCTNYTMLIVSLISFSAIVIGVVMVIAYRNKNPNRLQKQNHKEIEKMYNAPHLKQAASSVDSENQFADTGEQWRGQPNKCYSCEKDMRTRCGGQCAYQATKTKCFDC